MSVLCFLALIFHKLSTLVKYLGACNLSPSLSTPSRRYTLCRTHTCALSSCAAPKIPILSLPSDAQISQLYFVHSLNHLSDVPCMDPRTPPHIREWGVLVTYRLNFSYFYFPFSKYALRNVVPARVFEPCNLPDLPSLNHFI